MKWKKRRILLSIAAFMIFTTILWIMGCAGPRTGSEPHPSVESPAESPASSPEPQQEPEPDPEQQLFERARTYFAILPGKMPGAEADTPEMVRLGEALFFNTEISASAGRSCNDCHPVDFRRGGTINLPAATGLESGGGLHHVPTVYNAGFGTALFMDGGNGNTGASGVSETENFHSALLVASLEGNKLYTWAFGRAFPEEENPLSRENAIRALGAYLRTLITQDRFDLYLQGRQDALTTEEKDGLRIFIESKCVQCHDGPLLGGTFRAASAGKAISRENKGGKVSGRDALRGLPLRNILLTAPYFYDGHVATLPEAIERMGDRQLHIELSGDKINAILQFLTTLSDIELTSAAPPAEAMQPGQWNPPDPRKPWPEAGERVYLVRCQGCHAADGGGYRSASKEEGKWIVPPLWGPESHADGPPMHRVLFAAGSIRSNMPLGAPCQRPALSAEEALDVAAYINSLPRPETAGVKMDYPDIALRPADWPFPAYADGFSRDQHKYGPFGPIIRAGTSLRKPAPGERMSPHDRERRSHPDS